MIHSKFQIHKWRLNQALTYETCNCKLASHALHILIKNMSFRCAMYWMSHFTRFFNLDITKKFAKENTVLNFISHSTKMESLVFSLKHKKTSSKWLKIELKLFNTGPFSQMKHFFCSFSFNACTLPTRQNHSEWLNNEIKKQLSSSLTC